jgi:hypothetical protein
VRPCRWRGERLREALEAPVVSTGFRQLVKSSFRVFDLISRRKINRRIVGDVDHILADLDERTTDRQVVNRMPVVFSVDDCCRFGGEPRQILTDGEAANVDVAIKERSSV